MKTLLKEGYKLRPQKSSEKIVLTQISASRLYERFACGVPTVWEQHLFEWVPGWSSGQFYDANGLELVDENDSKRPGGTSMRAKIERKKVNILIPVELLDRVTTVEKGRYRTFTDLIVNLLLKHVEQEEGAVYERNML